MKRAYFFFLMYCLLAGFESATAKEYTIRSAADLAALTLQPGDKVLMAGGDWIDQKLVFKANGTPIAPISLRATVPGELVLKGNSSLLIDGNWLVVEGLKFSEGYTAASEHVITFSERSSNCRLTNTAIIDYNPPDTKAIFNFWILVYGIRNRVDHCFIKGKTTRGTEIGINISDKPNYHRIDHNYFGPRPDIKANGGEIIRIGTDVWSMHDSYTTVEDNVFEHCDGEIEIISNKSTNNTIRNNLFFESKGTLTLRHGNRANVYGNYFIGNGVEGCGGIRIVGEDHVVKNNYLYGLTGNGLWAALSIMNAWEAPPLHGYWQVKNAEFSGNTIVNCKNVFVIGAGKDQKTFLPPLNVRIANNNFMASGNLIQRLEENAEIKFENNCIYASKASDGLPKGFKTSRSKLIPDSNNIYQLAKKGHQDSAFIEQLLNVKDIGVSWMSYKRLEVKLIK